MRLPSTACTAFRSLRALWRQPWLRYSLYLTLLAAYLYVFRQPLRLLAQGQWLNVLLLLPTTLLVQIIQAWVFQYSVQSIAQRSLSRYALTLLWGWVGLLNYVLPVIGGSGARHLYLTQQGLNARQAVYINLIWIGSAVTGLMVATLLTLAYILLSQTLCLLLLAGCLLLHALAGRWVQNAPWPAARHILRLYPLFFLQLLGLALGYYLAFHNQAIDLAGVEAWVLAVSSSASSLIGLLPNGLGINELMTGFAYHLLTKEIDSALGSLLHLRMAHLLLALLLALGYLVGSKKAYRVN